MTEKNILKCFKNVQNPKISRSKSKQKAKQNVLTLQIPEPI